jgi:mono/diheme cytochrome c family protein
VLSAFLRSSLQSALARFRASVLIASVLAAAVPASAAPAAPAISGFLESHCVKCHGPEKQKGDLRLDTLAAPPAESKRWLQVMEAIANGDMPPKKEPRPEPAKAAAFTASVTALLQGGGTKPSLAVRRMNRQEYEHTVHDLLGIDVSLAEFLPEDASVQGFDNVGDGLGISSVLLEKYLEAANAAFDAVIRRIKPLPPETRRANAMDFKENVTSVEQKRDGVIARDGAFVDFNTGWPILRLDPAHPIEPGIFRCRVAVFPHEPGNRTLTVGVFTGPLFGPGKRKYIGTYDVTGTAEAPRVIEFTTRMAENDAIHVLPWITPEYVTWRDKGEPRPGIATAWATRRISGVAPRRETPGRAVRAIPPTLSMVEDKPIYMRHRPKTKTHRVESSAPAADAERIIREFVPRAFRRPVDAETAGRYVKIALDRLALGRSFEESVRAGICAVLCSPQFLLLNAEPMVDDYGIASRLSYFLWSSLPDAPLMELAAQGKLRDPQVRRAQVDRMLADSRSQRLTQHFTGQWLDLRKIEFTTPDAKLYPEYNELLGRSMVRESHGFFEHLLKNDLSVANFVKSDFAIVNQSLAELYRIPGVVGHENMQVVKLPADCLRGGVLTQASVLKVTANGTVTSPVLRGVWVLDRLLGQPVPPPPPGVPAVEPDIRGATSLREQFTKHTEDASCARCHDRIDPVGFALEEFDPVGGHRTRYRSLGVGDRVAKHNYKVALAVDSTGETPDGTKFTNFREFREWLARDPERIARAVAKKLMIYGCGRRVGVTDHAAVESVVAASKPSQYGLRTMVREIAASDFFLRP